MDKNQKRKKLLDIKFSLFPKQIVKYYINKSLKDDNYYSMAYSDGSKSDYELLSGWDETGSIPLGLGLKLKEFMNDNNVALYIHRTAIINPENIFENDEALMDVMKNGLINNGNALSNGSQKELVPPISKTAELINHDIHMQINLKTHRYDSFGNLSTGSVILVIPQEYLSNEGEIIVDPNLVYNYNHGITYIKPEFIIGATTLNHGVCKFYSREELLSHKKEI